MPISKSQQKSVNKYIKNNYDRINVVLPKGEKEKIKDCADKQNESLNSYIKKAIEIRMALEKE